MRTLTSLLFALALVAPPVGAQLRAVGGQVGRVESLLRHARDDDSAERTGILVGAYVEVGTPAAWLSVLAEVSYAQRGGRYPLGPQGVYTGDVRADYLVMAVASQLRAGAGPVSAFAYAGPALESNLQVQSAVEFGATFRDASTQVLAGVAGAGLELALGGGRVVRAEMRRSEGLTGAFPTDDDEIKHRATEILVRFGARPPL